MSVRAVLLASVVTASCLVGACGSVGNGVTSPTSVGAGSSVDSSVPSDSMSTPPAAVDGVPARVEVCDAAKAQFAIGERASAGLLERTRVAAVAETARFLRPNQPITLEYLITRLNLGLDAREVVRSVTCG